MAGEFTVKTDRASQRKKYLITFLSFFAAMAVVLAIFTLTTNQNREKWLGESTGLARESVFPFVFTEESDLYIMTAENRVLQIDNHVKAPVYDTLFSAVYYIYEPESELYEYDVKTGTRKKLCGDVAEFLLFEERTGVFCMSENGAVRLYRRDSGKSVTVRDPLSGGTEAWGDAARMTGGKAGILFFDGVPGEDGAAVLKYSNLEGRTRTVTEQADFRGKVFLLNGDRAAGYQAGDNFEVTDLGREKTVTVRGGIPVTDTPAFSGISGTGAIECLDHSLELHYVFGDIDEESGLGTLYRLKYTAGGPELSAADRDVVSVVGGSAEDKVAVYAKKSGEGLSLWKTRNGGNLKQLTLCREDASFLLEPDSLYLYVTEGNETYAVDINDRAAKKVVVAGAAESLVPYGNKPFALVAGKNGEGKTLVKKGFHAETYAAGEERLYGRGDNSFLMFRRENGSDFGSLDLVTGGVMTRISGNCSAEIVYDDKLEKAVYWSEGKLYVFRGGESVEAGDFPAEILPVPVLAKNYRK